MQLDHVSAAVVLLVRSAIAPSTSLRARAMSEPWHRLSPENPLVFVRQVWLLHGNRPKEVRFRRQQLPMQLDHVSDDVASPRCCWKGSLLCRGRHESINAPERSCETSKLDKLSKMALRFQVWLLHRDYYSQDGSNRKQLPVRHDRVSDIIVVPCPRQCDCVNRGGRPMSSGLPFLLKWREAGLNRRAKFTAAHTLNERPVVFQAWLLRIYDHPQA